MAMIKKLLLIYLRIVQLTTVPGIMVALWLLTIFSIATKLIEDIVDLDIL